MNVGRVAEGLSGADGVINSPDPELRNFVLNNGSGSLISVPREV